GLDCQKKPILTRTVETRCVEDRVIRLRQSVQRQHAADGGKRGNENRRFERWRNERHPRVKRTAADVHWEVDDLRPVLEGVAGESADDAAREHNRRDQGLAKAKRLGEPVNGKWRERV